VIRVEDLSVAFRAGGRVVPAVRGVSFAVPKGAAFGLVGESGSGKTTVLRTIAGLIDDWDGRIEVDGVPMGAKRDRAARRQLQMVFQDPYGSLHPRHTVARTLAAPLRLHGVGERDRRIDAALADVGLDRRFRYRYPNQLSGGQRQRVAIARALILEPAIVLLDEPTSALDVSVQAEVLDLLDRLRRERALTYILVSHDLGVVVRLCETMAVMRNGEVVETATASAFRKGAVATDYARGLIESSRGYRRETRMAEVAEAGIRTT